MRAHAQLGLFLRTEALRAERLEADGSRESGETSPAQRGGGVGGEKRSRGGTEAKPISCAPQPDEAAEPRSRLGPGLLDLRHLGSGHNLFFPNQERFSSHVSAFSCFWAPAGIMVLGKVRALAIYFDTLNENNLPVFSGGDLVSGRVVVEVTGDVRVKSLDIHARGVAKVRWTESRNAGANTTYTQNYTEEVEYLHHYDTLIGEERGESRASACVRACVCSDASRSPNEKKKNF